MLAKLALCRTAALGGRVYQCSQCQERCPLYNSCLDRHCPQCRGGSRADWLDGMAELLLPGINYFQVVFTVPEELSALMLGNRRATYGLLFRAAWSALRDVLREEVGCEPAAFDAWLQAFRDRPWVVYIEPPPTADARPESVLKYLARYLTGGSISDRRLLDHRDAQVAFSVRNKNKRAGNPAEPYRLSGVEFARRWAMQILPKGGVKSRGFGGYSGRYRRQDLRRCRAQLGVQHDAPQPAIVTDALP